MDLGSIFLIAALALIVGIFISQPLIKIKENEKLIVERKSANQVDHLRSALLAEQERLLTALMELDFDHTLGKIPAEDYPHERAALLHAGGEVLRQLDALQPEKAKKQSAEERLEAVVASRRADAARNGGLKTEIDDLELAIAARRRERQEKSAGFCPKCGNAVQKSDVFCSRCGTTLTS